MYEEYKKLTLRLENEVFQTFGALPNMPYFTAHTNCRLSPAEQVYGIHAFLLLERYVRTHPVSHRMGCNLFVVKDDQLPLIEKRPWINGTAQTAAFVRLDRIRQNSKPENLVVCFMLTILEQVCCILYDEQDELRVKKIVFEIFSQDKEWFASHRCYPEMFDEEGNRIPELSKEEQINNAAAGSGNRDASEEEKASESSNTVKLNGESRWELLGDIIKPLPVPPALQERIFGLRNCLLQRREYDFALHALELLAEYSKTHPFRFGGRVYLFVVKDSHVPIRQINPSVLGTSCGLAVVHMDRIRAGSNGNNSAEMLVLILLEELCHILYDVRDEHRVKEIVCDIANIGYHWVTPHLWRPSMFDEEGNWIDRPPKEERIKLFMMSHDEGISEG